MIYGFSPHTADVTLDLKIQGLPCRRKGCNCIPYDNAVHGRKAREERAKLAAACDAALESISV